MPDQTFPAPESGDVPAAPKPVAPGSGLTPNTAAGLACLGTLPTALVFYFVDRRDAFVRLYSLQMIVWSAGGLMVSKLFDLSLFVFDHVPLFGRLIVPLLNLLYGLFGMVWVCGWLAMAVLAFMGKPLRVPPFVAMVRRYLFPPR
jgi:uncharacterized membrane protein